MRKAHALPLFGDAYLADTRHLTLEEHGAYLQLLLIAWRTDDCSLPADDRRLAMMLGITPKKWGKLKPQVMAFWELTDTGWQQKRLLKERRMVAKKSEQNAEAANTRWHGKSLKDNNVGDANAMRMQCERNAPLPLPTSRTLAKANGASADSDKIFWDTAKSYLAAESRNPGALLGKWCRDFGKPETAAAITRAQLERPVQIVPFIEGALRKRGKVRPVVPI